MRKRILLAISTAARELAKATEDDGKVDAGEALGILFAILGTLRDDFQASLGDRGFAYGPNGPFLLDDDAAST